MIASQLLLRCSSPCITSALTFDLPISPRSRHGGTPRHRLHLEISWQPLLHPLWHHRYVTSNHLERLAQAAYEAHRGAHPGPLPAWEDTTELEQHAWRAAVSAVAGQSGKTVSEAALTFQTFYPNACFF